MMEPEVILALFRPVHIREEPEEVRQFSEDQRQRQQELINDLIAEQNEQR